MKRLFQQVLIAIIPLSVCLGLTAQEKTAPAFKIVLENTAQGINMQSIEGSAWRDLSFSVASDHIQAVNEFGMVDLSKDSSSKDSSLAVFLFTITKNETEIILKGIKGTAWTDLSFSLAEKEKQAINQLGMTTLN